ncbi:transcription elongation factor [Clavulina sp. PMI_390]|nr:transcription elongation factor [Clavulina sp. PMI_390]
MNDKEEIKKLVKALNAEGTTGSKPEILGILKRFEKGIAATEQLLKETKVGVAVSKQRTNPDREISELAKAIVKKWKGAVRAPDEKEKTAKAEPSTSASPAAVRSPPPPAKSTAQPSSSNGSSSTAPTTFTVRSIKTDSPALPRTQDKTRDKCMELIYDALASDSGSPTELLAKKAGAVESTVYSTIGNVNADYRNKMRQLYTNLKDKNNKSLRESVVSGEVTVVRFCSMSPQEMASEERKQANKALDELNMFKSLGAQEQEAETDMFQCGRCKQRKTRYRQAQTRSADEPMTTFVTCTNCGNRWKFS